MGFGKSGGKFFFVSVCYIEKRRRINLGLSSTVGPELLFVDSLSHSTHFISNNPH